MSRRPTRRTDALATVIHYMGPDPAKRSTYHVRTPAQQPDEDYVAFPTGELYFAPGLTKAHAAARGQRRQKKEPANAVLDLQDDTGDKLEMTVMWHTYEDTGSVRLRRGTFRRATYGSLLAPGRPDLEGQKHTHYLISTTPP